MKNAGSYEALARLLEYPRAAGEALAHACSALLHERNVEAAEAIDAFDAATRDLSLEDLEELYARTFDLDPTHAMDLGWQLFGETYKRGVFLVKMQGALATHDIDKGTELADHLPLVLRLLARLADDEDPHGLVEEVVLPAVAKLRTAMPNEGQPHKRVLDAIELVLRADFGVERFELPMDSDAARQAAFIGNRRALPVLRDSTRPERPGDTLPEEYR